MLFEIFKVSLNMLDNEEMGVRKCFVNKDEKWWVHSQTSNCYKKGIFCYIFSDILWWIWEIECYDVVICLHKFEGFYLLWVIVSCEKLLQHQHFTVGVKDYQRDSCYEGKTDRTLCYVDDEWRKW